MTKLIVVVRNFVKASKKETVKITVLLVFLTRYNAAYWIPVNFPNCIKPQFTVAERRFIMFCNRFGICRYSLGVWKVGIYIYIYFFFGGGGGSSTILRIACIIWSFELSCFICLSLLLSKKCLNDIYSKVRAGQEFVSYISCSECRETGRSFCPLRSSFAQEYTLRKVLETGKDWSCVAHVSLWSTLLMLIYWGKT
jgi:hypothetical protein